MGKPWVKLWNETRHDRKLRSVDLAWRWCWCGVLMVAADYVDTGELLQRDRKPITDEDMADELGAPLKTWLAAKTYFLDREMLVLRDDGVLVVKNYPKRQAPDPTHAKRQAEYRKRNASRNASRDASCDASCDGVEDRHTEQQKTEDRRQKIEEHMKHLTPPPPRVDETRARKPKSGGGGDGPTLVAPEDFSAEQDVAWNLALTIAPNFNGLEAFIREHDPRQIGYFALQAGEQIEGIDNPAGWLRANVERGDWPRLRGELSAQWDAMVRSRDGWRGNGNGKHG